MVRNDDGREEDHDAEVVDDDEHAREGPERVDREERRRRADGERHRRRERREEHGERRAAVHVRQTVRQRLVLQTQGALEF